MTNLILLILIIVTSIGGLGAMLIIRHRKEKKIFEENRELFKKLWVIVDSAKTRKECEDARIMLYEMATDKNNKVDDSIITHRRFQELRVYIDIKLHVLNTYKID